MSTALEMFAPDVWVKKYPIRYSGCTFPALMTVIRLKAGRLLIHSPCEIDSQTKAEIADLGPTTIIVAPGTSTTCTSSHVRRHSRTRRRFSVPASSGSVPKSPSMGFSMATHNPNGMLSSIKSWWRAHGSSGKSRSYTGRAGL